MNIDQFWATIEASRSRVSATEPDGNMARQAEELRKLLSRLSPEEVSQFDEHFTRLLDEAYTWELWGAAFVMGHGCSDDGFADFRSWLISMGRGVYERALADPDSLAAAASLPEVEDFFFEELPSVPEEVYAGMTGKEIPGYSGPRPREPRGRKWEEDELERRFSKLWRKFG